MDGYKRKWNCGASLGIYNGCMDYEMQKEIVKLFCAGQMTIQLCKGEFE